MLWDIITVTYSLPVPFALSLSKCERSWFDRLTTNGEKHIPFALSLSKGGAMIFRFLSTRDTSGPALPSGSERRAMVQPGLSPGMGCFG